MIKSKLSLLFVSLFFVSGLNFMHSQIQEGNIMWGGAFTNMDFGLKKGQSWNIGITPKAAYFIKNNLAVGGYGKVNISKQGTGSTTKTEYGVGAFGRYYASNKDINNLLKHGRFFFEANAGFEGSSQKHEPTTNGFGFGFGPGYSYFITSNVGLEALVKYEGLTGGGNTGYQHDITFAIGLQVYIPSSRVKNAIQNPNQL